MGVEVLGLGVGLVDGVCRDDSGFRDIGVLCCIPPKWGGGVWRVAMVVTMG